LDENILPQRALVIVAHPDDVEYYCGGTLAGWICNGCEVTYLVTSSGEKGSHDLSIDAKALSSLREEEQRDSAMALGVKGVVFLRLPDSELSFVNPDSLRGEFVRYIRSTRADVVLTHDPLTRLTRQHPDHRFVGQLAIDAAFPLSAVPQCYKEQIVDEGLMPHQPAYVLLFGTDQPNYWVDIGPTLEAKIDALSKHRSQVSAFDGGISDRLRWKAQMIGQRARLRAAEEFLIVRVGPTLPTSNSES